MTHEQDPKPKTGSSAAPRWITPLLAVAALFAFAASVTVLIFGGSPGLHRHNQVADITLNLGGQPVREHCTTCHVDGGLPSLSDGGWSSDFHPDIAPHSPERLGCTGCHLGEGMALDVRLSHGVPGLGARQVLKGRDVQGRCYVCHEVAPLASAEKAWKGYGLFRRKACELCHHLAGLPGGLSFGPDLSHVGSQLGLDALEKAIRSPGEEPFSSIMPRFPLSSSQARDLAYFLKSRVNNPLTTSPMWVAAGRLSLPEVSLVPKGKTPGPGMDLLWRGRCLACHRFGEEDGRIAPDLSDIGEMRDRSYIEDFLRSPGALIPGAIMPPGSLTSQEQKTLVTFLATGTKGSPGHPEPRQLYMHFCQRCHAANGDGRGLIQPNLATMPRAFAGNAEFFRRLSAERIGNSVAKGIAGTSMPPYGELLSADQRDALMDLIFSAFIGISPQDKVELPPLPPRSAIPLAAQEANDIFERNCQRCHGRMGTGRGPDAAGLLPRPRNLTNQPYLASLQDVRILRAILDGVPGTAMPAWREELSPDEAWALVDKIRVLSGGQP